MAGVVSFAEALALVEEHARHLGAPAAETVELLLGRERVLAEDIRADRDQPPFDRATRDGFAVRAAEWSAGGRLRVAGQVRAGEVWSGGEVEPGCAVEIMTGAPVPPGVDAVAMVEHAVVSGGAVQAVPGRRLAFGENSVARGSEARRGEVVVRAGTEMGAAEIAQAATCGWGKLRVRRRPRVAIAATGDELVGLGEMPAEHQIRNSNGFALAALVEAAGGVPRMLAVARDTREDVRARIAEARGSDLVVLSGGVSAGRYDLVEEVLAEAGAEFFFTGVRLQPGRPTVFGRIPAGESHAACFFFGLPGNPISTQVTFHCFAEPFLRRLGGAAWAGPRFVQGTLAEAVPGKAGLTRVLPARLTSGFERTDVRLVGWQGSGDLASNARANCYAVIPDGAELKAGEGITVLLR
ncbi:MAG: molybdopterin molybdotransferase MoeA [Acidobacteriota bacterium]|nr:molybdopterin molybdotransferase MoeA [Acidobacteriota bacterium]